MTEEEIENQLAFRKFFTDDLEKMAYKLVGKKNTKKLRKKIVKEFQKVVDKFEMFTIVLDEKTGEVEITKHKFADSMKGNCINYKCTSTPEQIEKGEMSASFQLPNFEPFIDFNRIQKDYKEEDYE